MKPPNPSLWIATTDPTSYPPLQKGTHVDVAVVGGGIAGLSAAHLLKSAGKSVAVIESKRILHGVTGYTTAKVTAGHGLIYSEIEGKHGAEAARTYAESQTAAMELIRATVEEHAIDCDLDEAVNYVYTTDASQVDKVRNEVQAERDAGLDASFATDTPLPYEVRGAVRLDGQSQFHPRKYLLALARMIPGGGSHVFEETVVTDVSDGEPCTVTTSLGTMTAADVIIATHMPVFDRGLYFARVHPTRSYAVAGKIARTKAPAGMFISVDEPMRSLRLARYKTGHVLIIGGEHHRPGEVQDTTRFYEGLEDFGRRHFGVQDFLFRWSTQDNYSVDLVPYTGRLTRSSDHLYTTTGYGGWGMTNGTLGGMILSDLILGRDNPWAYLYDSSRIKPAESASTFIQENAKVAAHWVGDRIRSKPPLDALAPGTGAVVKSNGRTIGAYRDEAGKLSCVSAVCTHLGCIVGFNDAEKSWDCPCHGSRFALDGRVIQGPATKDLEAIDP
ncbi:MAG TPA: FAD-dependent oxidoreductase [Actinomycetota bacterium]|nr:FAD-dependent oxidoreductase [Actinomycetota bacterium]